jgi:hypothetical protein
MRLFHTPGEFPENTAVWIAEKGVLIPGVLGERQVNATARNY